MARILFRSLHRHSIAPSFTISTPRSAPSSCAFTFRNRTTQSGKAQLIEIDLDSSSSLSSSSSSSSSSDGDFEVLAIKKLEDMVQRIIVQKSTPDWLPFVPGSSFWVPPRRTNSLKVIDLVGKLADPLTDEEALSLSTSRGWPSSAFFARETTDVELEDSEAVEVEVEVKVLTSTEKSPSEEEEK